MVVELVEADSARQQKQAKTAGQEETAAGLGIKVKRPQSVSQQARGEKDGKKAQTRTKSPQAEKHNTETRLLGQ